MSTIARTEKQVNKAIAHTGLIIRRYRAGYCTFYDAKTGYQVGDSIMVYALCHMTIKEWVDAAERQVAPPKKAIS